MQEAGLTTTTTTGLVTWVSGVTRGGGTEGGEEGKGEGGGEIIADGTDQSKVEQEVLVDLKNSLLH